MASVPQEEQQKQVQQPTYIIEQEKVELDEIQPHVPACSTSRSLEKQQQNVVTNKEKFTKHVEDCLKVYRHRNACWRVMSIILMILSVANCVEAFILEYYWTGSAAIVSFILWSIWYKSTNNGCKAVDYQKWELFDTACWWMGAALVLQTFILCIYVVALWFAALTYGGVWDYKTGDSDNIEDEDDTNFLLFAVIALSLTVVITIAFMCVAKWLRTSSFQIKTILQDAGVMEKPQQKEELQQNQQQQQNVGEQKA